MLCRVCWGVPACWEVLSAAIQGRAQGGCSGQPAGSPRAQLRRQLQLARCARLGVLGSLHAVRAWVCCVASLLCRRVLFSGQCCHSGARSAAAQGSLRAARRQSCGGDWSLCALHARCKLAEKGYERGPTCWEVLSGAIWCAQGGCLQAGWHSKSRSCLAQCAVHAHRV